jgi:hypothetical protein
MSVPEAASPAMTRGMRRLSTRNILLGLSVIAALALVVGGLRAKDVLSIGRRPDPSAFHDFLLSIAIGFPLGGVFGFYMKHLYRRDRSFFVEFYGTPVSQRGWRLQRLNLLYCLPMFVGLEVLLTATIRLELPAEFALLAAALWLPVPAPQLGEILRSSWERKIDRQQAGDQPTQPANQWTGEITARRYSERLAVSLLAVAAVGFTGYTLALPRFAEMEESRAILRQMFAHTPAEHEEFYRLTHEARNASRTCSEKRLADGETAARELLRIYSGFPYDWNQGNAIHYANLVLGRTALRRGDTRVATRYLFRAGGTPGSPQLGDYGPDLTLARELLERGEAPTVLRYLSLCSRFWRNEKRNCVLTEWSGEIGQGLVPDFGARAGPVPRPSEGWTCEALESGS